jgi:DNA-binding transcriptional ArsR family regulator
MGACQALVEGEMPERKWTFLTNHGVVFLHIAQNPGKTIRQISDELGLAERTVASILADLREGGYVTIAKQGKRNTYTVHPELPMRHPSTGHLAVRDFFAILRDYGKRRALERPPTPRAGRSG